MWQIGSDSSAGFWKYVLAEPRMWTRQGQTSPTAFSSHFRHLKGRLCRSYTLYALLLPIKPLMQSGPLHCFTWILAFHTYLKEAVNCDYWLKSVCERQIIYEATFGMEWQMWLVFKPHLHRMLVLYIMCDMCNKTHWPTGKMSRMSDAQSSPAHLTLSSTFYSLHCWTPSL